MAALCEKGQWPHEKRQIMAQEVLQQKKNLGDQSENPYLLNIWETADLGSLWQAS